MIKPQLAIISINFLAGCSAGYDMGMKVEKKSGDFVDEVIVKCYETMIKS